MDDTKEPSPEFVRAFEQRLKQPAEAEPKNNAPTVRSKLGPLTSETPNYSLHQQSPLQIIASGIKRLVWDDSEKLGDMIAAHLKEPGEHVSGSIMSKAVQAAADDIMKEGG